MPKQKINDPGAHHASSGALIRRFLPYLVKYKKTLFLDLFSAAQNRSRNRGFLYLTR